MNKARPFVALAVTALVAYTVQEEEEPNWPRQIDAPEATIIMYQPQVDSLEGNLLSGRAAVSVTRTEENDPVFGTIWATAQVDTDRDTREAILRDVRVKRVRFPNPTPEAEQRLTEILEAEIPKWDLTLSLDRLLASLDLAEQRRTAAEGLNNDPPKIIFSTEPAVLITIDGEPRQGEVENTDLMRIINTPFSIVFSPDDRRYYLYAGDDNWYTTQELMGDWELTQSVPAQVAALTPPDSVEQAAEAELDSLETEIGPPPSIIVATEPTELIVTDGPPEYTPIEGTGLLYVSNSESDVLMEIDSQRFFVILSGRWYASTSLEGPWSYIPGDELPEDFANIPEESDMGHLLVWVPGTELAEEAVLDNQIPQTAAVSRSDAKLEVEYDGEPQFEPIEDTEMSYAANTATAVIKVGDKYYACDEAVWFVADSPSGPWVVADVIPAEIYTIPPESPVYNTTYVYVYDSTPEVVYVGYYPGYVGSYTYGGTVVYGTGWYYPAWYGTVYYARPATWGFHVRWNPWYGWSFGFSYAAGPFRFTIGFGGWYRGGWGWGPYRYGYRHGYRRGYHRGWHHGYRAGARAGARAGYRAANRQNNVYRSQANRARTTRPATAQTRNRANTAPNRNNNVYSDRSGSVYRQNRDGSWQQRSGNNWQSSGQSRQNIDRNKSQLDRSAQSRQRGTQRTNNYNRSRGGGRAGGRRR